MISKKFMKKAFHLLQKNDTGDLVILPPRRKIVKCKWVFKTKFTADGSPMKYKEHLVAKGFSQVQCINYNEIFPSCKDGLHKISFGHYSFQAVRNTSHGCKECFPTW